MNPLSLLTYYRRHLRRAALLIALLALAVMGLYLFIGLAQEIYITPAYAINQYLSKFSLVEPDLVKRLDPGVADQVRAYPDVAQVLPQANIRLKVANVGGAYFSFRLFGLHEPDMVTVLTRCAVTLKEGQLPQPGTNGVALSDAIATALNLKIGDTFDRTQDERLYINVVSPLRLVGILSGDVRLGLMSYEYLDTQAIFQEQTDYGLLVIARPGYDMAVADFLSQRIRNAQTNTYTYQSVTEQVSRDQQLLKVLGIPIVLLVTIAITLVIGAINRLEIARRLSEFGTLYAVGFSRGRLTHRLTLETAGIAVIGLALGILLAWGGMAILSATIYAPRGFAFTPFQIAALPFVIPIPLAVIGFALFAAVRTLERMDAVSIVERGELNLEGDHVGASVYGSRPGLPRPLASATYYRRHRRQAVVSIGAMVLMTVSTALIIFVFAAGADATLPALTNLSRISAVAPNNQSLEVEVINRIRAHPEVERVITVYTFTPLKISIPPMLFERPVETLCVNAEDMAYLVTLYHLSLAEGDLPRPDSNEIVFPWAVAQNRNIKVGDVVGDRNQPIYPGAPTLPVDLVVSGIFAPADQLADETWLSFMSLDFVEPYRASGLSLIVVPRSGQKATLDAWLESDIAGATRIVYTYRNQQAALQKEMRPLLFTFGLMESIIALVAVLALAGVNYLFVVQRQAEFGILKALGFSRAQLISRLLKETLFTTSAAWLVGVLGCIIILLCLQYGLYDSVGLRLNFFNPTPWLFTLLVPVAVLMTNTATATGILSRLDPIAMIERR